MGMLRIGPGPAANLVRLMGPKGSRDVRSQEKLLRDVKVCFLHVAGAVLLTPRGGISMYGQTSESWTSVVSMPIDERSC